MPLAEWIALVAARANMPAFSHQDLVKALRKPQAEPGAGDFGPARGGEIL